MTLFRQIAALISLIFLLIMTAVVWNDFRYSSISLQGQMHTVAQDMATMMGVAMANSGNAADPAAVDTFFNTVFDSGYLASIGLYSPQGDLLQIKSQEIAIRNVPNWFVTLVDFEPPVGHSQVMSKWIQIGTLKLTLHPGYAYVGLYDSLKSVMLWLAFITVGGLMVLWWALGMILRPLRAVKAQADAIHENRFIQQPELPRTLELRRVVEVMNRMVGKVQDVLADQAEVLNRYHELLYRDSLTGVGNRRLLVEKLDASTHGGYAAFVYLHGLDELAQRDGFEKTHDLVIATARAIETELWPNSREFVARPVKYEFAYLLERDADEAEDCVRSLFAAFEASAKAVGADDLVWMCAGLVDLSAGTTVGEVMAEADLALTRAKSSGADTLIHEEKSAGTLPRGRIEWRNFLHSCIDNQRFFLVAQPVFDTQGRVDHREVFVRLEDKNGEMIPAGLFMPMASTLGIDQGIDMEVLRMAQTHLREHGGGSLALNLSPTLFTDAAAIAALEHSLDDPRGVGGAELQLEARHFLLKQHPQAAEMICTRLREKGYRLGVDNFDLSLSLELLQMIRPAYVKVNARTLAEMASEAGTGGLRALTTITGGLEIRLIATGVDSEELRTVVNDIGVDALQGNFMAVAENL